MATHSSILAWEIPCTEEPGRVQSMGSQRVGHNLATAAAKLLQSCPTLYDTMDGSLPGSSVRGISQARILEWVAVSFSRGSSRPRDRTRVSRIGADALTSEPPGSP